MGEKKLSAFNVFMKVTLAQIKAENPDIKHTEAFRQATIQWKAKKEAEKK